MPEPRNTMSSLALQQRVLKYQLTAVMVWMFIGSVSAVVDLITHLPLTNTASIPTLELIRSTWRTLFGEIWWYMYYENSIQLEEAIVYYSTTGLVPSCATQCEHWCNYNQQIHWLMRSAFHSFDWKTLCLSTLYLSLSACFTQGVSQCVTVSQYKYGWIWFYSFLLQTTGRTDQHPVKILTLFLLFLSNTVFQIAARL